MRPEVLPASAPEGASQCGRPVDGTLRRHHAQVCLYDVTHVSVHAITSGHVTSRA